MINKSAMLSIIGRPNVGKSTLVNKLVGEKIAIVSNKPQTTRNRIFAVITEKDTQLVLLDTPGFHKAKTRLGDYMVKVVHESFADVDAMLLLVEPEAKVGTQEQLLIERLKQTGVPAVLVINKIDSIKKEELLEVIAVYSQTHEFEAIIPISARTGENIEELKKIMRGFASEGPQLFPEDMVTDNQA